LGPHYKLVFARIGDYVVKSPDGAVRVVGRAEFDATYRLVPEDMPAQIA
jgi:hypothetical protein